MKSKEMPALLRRLLRSQDSRPKTQDSLSAILLRAGAIAPLAQD